MVETNGDQVRFFLSEVNAPFRPVAELTVQEFSQWLYGQSPISLSPSAGSRLDRTEQGQITIEWGQRKATFALKDVARLLGG